MHKYLSVLSPFPSSPLPYSFSLSSLSFPFFFPSLLYHFLSFPFSPLFQSEKPSESLSPCCFESQFPLPQTVRMGEKVASERKLQKAFNPNYFSLSICPFHCKLFPSPLFPPSVGIFLPSRYALFPSLWIIPFSPVSFPNIFLPLNSSLFSLLNRQIL